VSLALLFSGQGTQHPAMLPWLDACPAAAPALAGVSQRFGADWRLRLQDLPWAQRNAVAQPLLTGLDIAAWQALSPLLPRPAVVAGYSVGELAAFCAAGVLDGVQALALASERAGAMDRCVVGQDTGLLAVNGADSATRDACCQRCGLAIAIYMASDRVVLGGLSEALSAGEVELTASGARCTRLAIGIASHTPWMAAAAAEFEALLADVPLRPPNATLVCNFSGTAERDTTLLRQQLARQIAAPVQWQACMEAVAERRVRCVLEIGPGSALAKLWNEQHPDIPARSADEFRSAASIARWVGTTLA
jgi:[acyl-carrier-protein] S-malonyltransferase